MATASYFPTIPPKAPKAAMSYSRSVAEAPLTALMGVVVDGRQPKRHAVTPRCRMRTQVGFTNRWRLPESLGGDLLGTAQAIKAICMPYNSSLRSIITAENPQNTVNCDSSQPYSFRIVCDRPHTSPDPFHSQRSPINQRPFSSASAPTATKTSCSRPKVLNTCMPSSARPAKPLDVFQYHSKRAFRTNGPDVLLQCLGLNWELHRPYLQKSQTLANLLMDAGTPGTKRYYRNKASKTLDEYIAKSNFYSNEYQEMSNRLATEDVNNVEGSKVAHPKHVSEQRTGNVSIICLDINDPCVTEQALAVALGNLYHDDIEVDTSDVVGVLAAAHILKFKTLQDGCVKILQQNVGYSTVCDYHRVAVKYQEEQIQFACERWLELNLVSQLSHQIQLRLLPLDLLLKVLKSNRLFTFSEFWVYRVAAYWVFLQLNPNIQLMPSYSTVLTYFNSLPKSCSLIEREEGQLYMSLFMAVRLHGITDTNNLRDIQTMNLIPQAWVLKVLTQQQLAVQAGGDMSLMNNFNTGAIRQGFILDDEPRFHSEILSLHGFHFELKAVRQNKVEEYSFFMQRLKPGDPILSFKQCERSTFSLRPDRDVRYSISIQYFDKDKQRQNVTTGILTQRFGLGTKTSKSQELNLVNMTPPLYVTFSVLFPPS